MVLANGATLATRFERLAQQAPLAFATLTVGFLMTVAVASLEPSFQTNDDPQLAMIASGTGIGLRPDEHLVFTNIVVGRVLKALYTTFPSVPWYGGYLYLAQFLAQVAILCAAIVPRYTRLRLTLYLLFFATVGVFLLNNLQFTTTASLVGQSGVLVWLMALGQRDVMPKCQIAFAPCAGAALLVLASLIRLECFYMTVLVAGPAILCFIGRPRRPGVWLSLVATAAGCVAMILALAAYNDDFYNRDPQWRSFFSYNKLRVKFNDYELTEYTPRTAHVFQQVGWSKNDYEMIAHWFYEDAELYSEARLEKAIEGYPWQAERRRTIVYWWSSAREILRDRSLWPAVLISPLFIWCAARSRRNVLAFAGCLSVAVALLILIAAFGKPPPSRVYFSALTFPLALMLLISRESARLPQWHWRPSADGESGRALPANVLVLLTVAALVLGLARQYRTSMKMNATRDDLRQLFDHLEPGDDHLYVIWAPGFPYEAISPFDNLQWLSKRRQLVLGWPQRTPIALAMLGKYGIADLAKALYERRDLCLVGRDYFHPLYCQFVKEHYHVAVHFLPVHAGNRDYHLAGRFEKDDSHKPMIATDARAPAPRR